MTYDHASHFRQQAEWCTKLGSPFTAALLERAAAEIDVVAPLFAPRAWRDEDAAALRFAGALNAAVLEGWAEDLARLYPPAAAAWDMDAVWREAKRVVAARPGWFAAFLERPPQTNEARRAIALLPAFLAPEIASPLHMLEIGASAGLNLCWDRFRYETAAWAWGPQDPAAPRIDTDWRGAPPDLARGVEVASRAGCDAHPLSVADAADRLRLRAYVWPDQRERVERCERAADLAARLGVRVEAADAGDWLEGKLADGPPRGTTVVYHSIVWPYLSPSTRARVEGAILAAAARATAERRLAWVRFEQDSVIGREGGGFSVDVRSWPGDGAPRVVARTDPHGRWVEPV